MRVTNNMLINNMVYNLGQNMKAMEKLQYQLATGKKFRVPSDDPIGASKSLKFNTDISKLKQYKRNAEDAMSWLDDTEAALGEINEVLKRAYELAVQVANGTYEGDDLNDVKEEIAEAVKEAGYHIIQGKGYTNFGVAIAVTRIVKAILNDENALLPVSSLYTGEYGIEDIYLGAPCMVGRIGVKRIFQIPIDENELRKLKASADSLKALTKDLNI